MHKLGSNSRHDKFFRMGLGMFCMISGICATIGQTAGQGQEEKAAQESVPLPTDPGQLVCSLQYSGGFRAPPPAGFEETPLVRVFGDGRVVTGGSSPHAKIVEWKMARSELEALVADLVQRDRFPEISSQAIAREIEQSGQPISIADAPDTEIVLIVGGKTHRVKQYATRFLKTQFPQIDALQRLAQAEDRLRRVYALAHLGGEAAVENLLVAINARISNDRLAVPEFESGELTWANHTDRGLTVQFAKYFSGPDGRQMYCSVNIVLKPDGSRDLVISEPAEMDR